MASNVCTRFNKALVIERLSRLVREDGISEEGMKRSCLPILLFVIDSLMRCRF